MRLSDENLRGRTIIAADGQVVGEVVALFLDSDTWRVESLRVKLGKAIADQLGANRSVFRAGALEIPVRMAQSVGDTVVLSVPVEGLREVLPSARAGADGAPAKKRANKQAIAKAKLEHKAKAIEKARLEQKANKQAIEKAKLEHKAKAIEKARLEQKAKVVEKVRLEKKTRLEKKAKVVAKARLEKKAKAVEKARLAKKAKGAKEAGKAAVM